MRSPDVSGSEHSDVVIVGAGSAGCVLAEKLSRDGARSVLLLEQGPSFPDVGIRDLRRLPVGADSRYVTTIPERSGQVVVRGRGLGGSSAINGGYFLRWHDTDFAGWPAGWDRGTVESAYRELDDPDGTMSVRPAADAELGAAASAFESFWSARVPVRDVAHRWPIVGLNRVLGNHLGGLRMTAAEAYLRPAAGRPNLRVVTGARVGELLVRGRTVTGVRTVGGADISGGEVILCAGTLGTAELLLRSPQGALRVGQTVRVGEHREIQVGYGRRGVEELKPLLQTVVHTDDGVEIRCYSDDFDRYISGGAGGRPVIGIAGMTRAGRGEVTLGVVAPGGVIPAARGGLRLSLAPLDPADAAAMWSRADDVADMLASTEFGDLVVPGSIVIDPVIRTSQHAWGSMPMGETTDGLGAVDGVRGLRIVDGSILPTPGRSGPHATTMMMACRIGDDLAAGDHA
ncbi:mycofactocin system GMC family oxidoreductase MftG [Gordonia sp. DT219]|uniref:mycofactocin system GMC family oxidoreductase MftG n=1 Tax=Gordonia sp. DT219 TaxID=3416658 RepID=UPI003CEFE60A